MTLNNLELSESPAKLLLDVVNATSAAVAANPKLAVMRPETITTWVQGTTTQVSVQSGVHDFTIDEPPTLAGQNLGATPLEHLLAALGSCQIITYQVWAAKLGVEIESIQVSLAGDIDVHGFFGLNPEVRAGFQSIELKVAITGSETAERYAELTKLVEEHCPVLDVLTVGIPVNSIFSYN